MQYTIGNCKGEGCGKVRPIVNRRYWFCNDCNKIRLNKQKDVYPLTKNLNRNPTFKYSTRWGYATEMGMFQHIYRRRPHLSFISRTPITTFRPINFLHVLPKGLNKYPQFRFNPDNIVLGTPYEHFLFDQGSEHLREKYGHDWTPLYELADKLKLEYAELFPPK